MAALWSPRVVLAWTLSFEWVRRTVPDFWWCASWVHTTGAASAATDGHGKDPDPPGHQPASAPARQDTG